MEYLIMLWNKIVNKIKKIGIKKTILVFLGIFLIIVIIFIMSRFVQNKMMENKVKNKQYTSMADFESVEEVVTYMGCTYIKEENKNNNKYIYLEFNKDFYDENGQSNQKFFENLSVYIANVLKYSNYIMVDKSKNNIIEIICDKKEKKVTDMIINGNNNYFSKEDSKKELDKYKETQNTELKINSSILVNSIKNNWNATGVNYGSKESNFEKYDIYFDEGMEVRKTANKIFNIVFTNKYKDSIVNNIKVGTSFDDIKKTLGTPTFEQENIIGYKSKYIYIFFEKDEISVYRVDKTNDEEFVKLINNIKQDSDLNKIANELTDIWSDYDKYENIGDSIKIVYSIKGVELNYNVSSNQGFILYSNYTGKVNNDKYLKDIKSEDIPKNVYLDTQYDLVFIAEETRVAEKSGLSYYCSLQMNNDEKNKLNNLSKKFSYYIKNNQGNKEIKFINKDGNYPNAELEEKINSYMWLDDYRFLYSIKKDGIYIYNLKDRKKSKLLEGQDDFTFKSYNLNVLKYDKKELKIN